MSDPWSVARLIAALREMPQDARVLLTTFTGPGSPTGVPHEIADVYSMGAGRVWVTCNVPAPKRPEIVLPHRDRVDVIAGEPAVLRARVDALEPHDTYAGCAALAGVDPGPEHRLLAEVEQLRAGDDVLTQDGYWLPIAAENVGLRHDLGVDVAGRRRIRPGPVPGWRFRDVGESLKPVDLSTADGACGGPRRECVGLALTERDEPWVTPWPTDPRLLTPCAKCGGPCGFDGAIRLGPRDHTTGKWGPAYCSAVCAGYDPSLERPT